MYFAKDEGDYIFLLGFYVLLVCIPSSALSSKNHRLIFDQLLCAFFWSRVKGFDIITQNI